MESPGTAASSGAAEVASGNTAGAGTSGRTASSHATAESATPCRAQGRVLVRVGDLAAVAAAAAAAVVGGVGSSTTGASKTTGSVSKPMCPRTTAPWRRTRLPGSFCGSPARFIVLHVFPEAEIFDERDRRLPPRQILHQ
jgi:hypothetical protein